MRKCSCFLHGLLVILPVGLRQTPRIENTNSSVLFYVHISTNQGTTEYPKSRQVSRSYIIVFKEMKKFILLILSVLCLSTSAFADETSCRVWGTDAVATIKNPVASLSDYSSGPCVGVSVEITETQTKDVNVVVNVYTLDNQIIGSGVVRILKGYTTGYALIQCRGKSEDVVNLRIARASCQ